MGPETVWDILLEYYTENEPHLTKLLPLHARMDAEKIPRNRCG